MIINEITHDKCCAAVLRLYTLVAISTTWVCAIMFLLSDFGRIHMCTLCKSQKGPAAGGGRVDKTEACCFAVKLHGRVI